jgi:hypothetical protein
VKNRFLFSATLWFIGMAVAFIAGALVADYFPGFFQGRHATSSQPQASSVKPPEDNNSLRAEVETLKTKLAQLEGERNKLSRDFLQLAMKQAFDSAGANPSPPDAVQSHWNNAVQKVLASRTKGMFGGMEEMINLAIEMASYGEAGIKMLGGVINDRTKPAPEREMALQILARLRSREAFEYLVKFRDQDILELDYPYDLIRYQVSSLPTDQIAPQISGIVNQINAELGADNYSPERPEVLLYLAATHNNAQAQQLLNDPRMWNENLAGAIDAAQAIHNQTAFNFLRAVEQQHQDPATRNRAASVLDSW